MIGPSRIGLRVMLFADAEKNTQLSEPIIQPSQNSDYEIDLKNYLQDHNSLKQTTTYARDLHKSRLERITRYLRRVWLGKDASYRDHFVFYGMTISKSLYVTLRNSIRKLQANSYLRKNTIKKLDDHNNFIYYPLHSEPERALSIVAPYFMNQIEIITHIAKSIPVEYVLFVKDHPIMPAIGTRSISFYKEIQKLPNVKLLHPSFDQEEILSNCSLVITISGTAGLEATFHNKPTITFSDLIYTNLPSIFTVKNLDELPLLIKNALKTKVEPRDLIKFVRFVESNSCISDITKMSLYFRIHFHNNKIKENDMKQLIEEFKPDYEELAKECISKFQANNSDC
jgi:capsule polysaccharide modification protein KpsS